LQLLAQRGGLGELAEEDVHPGPTWPRQGVQVGLPGEFGVEPFELPDGVRRQRGRLAPAVEGEGDLGALQATS
jgi:hypothetical protein